MLQERFGSMVLPLLGRVALWDCLFGAEAPCLLQPPPEIIRLFSPSPFSFVRARERNGFTGYPCHRWLSCVRVSFFFHCGKQALAYTDTDERLTKEVREVQR